MQGEYILNDNQYGFVVGHNSGLGDQIIMNGAVRYLAEMYDKVWFVTWENRAKHAKYLYKDCPNVEIYVKPSIASTRQGVMRMKAAHREIVENNPDFIFPKYNQCFWTSQKDWEKFAIKFKMRPDTIFPKIFYKILGVGYGTRYNFQKIPRDFTREKRLLEKLQLNNKPYIFAVDDCRSSKFTIDIDTDKTIVNPMDYPWWKDTLIYDWQMVMQLADEIHTVNTCWFHLARTLQLQVPKFYYAARKVKFCEQNMEFLNDDYDNGWKLVRDNWIKKDKKNWWLN